MLGKLIKNEFVHRGKPVATVFAGMIVLSLFECIISLIRDKGIANSVYFDLFFGIMTTVWIISLFAGFFGILMLSIGDYGNRFFKDQGYLTHTLPVKSSKLILARMICDVAIILAMIIVYPLVISIAVRNFEFYSEIIDFVYDFVSANIDGVEKALIVVDFISIIIGVFLGALFEVWHFYTAYAIGHMFNKGKKVASVVSYIVIYVVVQIIVLLFMRLMEIPQIDKIVKEIGNGIDSAPGELLLVLSVVNIVMVIGLAILAVVTNTVFKRRLNLE